MVRPKNWDDFTEDEIAAIQHGLELACKSYAETLVYFESLDPKTSRVAKRRLESTRRLLTWISGSASKTRIKTFKETSSLKEIADGN